MVHLIGHKNGIRVSITVGGHISVVVQPRFEEHNVR